MNTILTHRNGSGSKARRLGENNYTLSTPAKNSNKLLQIFSLISLTFEVYSTCVTAGPSWYTDGFGSDRSPSLLARGVLVIHASQTFSLGVRLE